MNADKIPHLKTLARLYNVQPSYYGMNHLRKQVAAESMLGVLKALGAPVASEDDIASAIRERTLSLRRHLMEPVIVAWNGASPVVKVCLPSKLADAPVTCRLETEAGEQSIWKINASDMPVLASADVEGTRYVTRGITLPQSLYWGYHKLVLEVKGLSCETLIISAPQKTYMPTGDAESRTWSAFIPLYALQGRDSWGSGAYHTFGALADRVVGKGGSIIATLPLLPIFLDEPFEPSPYAPVSRLLWNEFYVDVESVPELKTCTAAKALVQSASFREEIKKQQENPMVDYRKIISLRRRGLA